MSQERVEVSPERPQRLDSLEVMLPQDSAVAAGKVVSDRELVSRDTTIVLYADSLQKAVADTLNLSRFDNWRPDPIRAMWLAMVVP